MKKVKRKAISRSTKRKGRPSFVSSHKAALIVVLGIFTIIIVSHLVLSAHKDANTLGATSYLAKSGDDSGSGSSGSSDSGSGSSGSGSKDSDSSGSDSDESGDASSGSSGSGTSGSGSSGSQSVSPTSSLRFSLTPVPTSTDSDDEDSNSGRGELRVENKDGQTRLEQEIFENGVRKRIEMRNENGKILVRIKTEDALGNETDQKLELRPEDGRAKLTFEENGVEKEVTVRVKSNRFVIEQEGFGTTATSSAVVNFPLTIDTETNSIAVTTPLGVINVQQLPSTAIEGLLNSNVMDTVASTELDESETGTEDVNKQIVYRINGMKNTRFLGLITVDAPILAEVSAITGEQVYVEQPWYLNAFGFLFVK